MMIGGGAWPRAPSPWIRHWWLPFRVVSKISQRLALCDHNSPTSQTDRRTDVILVTYARHNYCDIRMPRKIRYASPLSRQFDWWGTVWVPGTWKTLEATLDKTVHYSRGWKHWPSFGLALHWDSFSVTRNQFTYHVGTCSVLSLLYGPQNTKPWRRWVSVVVTSNSGCCSACRPVNRPCAGMPRPAVARSTLAAASPQRQYSEYRLANT